MKITKAEIVKRFGNELPIEVVAFFWSDEAKDMTVAEVRAEIDKRWPPKPKITCIEVPNPDWSEVLKMARVRKAEHESNVSEGVETRQYIYEAVMTAVYGPSYFTWVRSLN